MMRRLGPTVVVLSLALAGAASAQPISFSYAGQSSSQGVNVYADGLLSLSEVSPGTSLLSLTVSNVRSDYTGGDDNLFFFGSAFIAPDDADFNGLNIFDSVSGNARTDLEFGQPNGLNGEMIDLAGTEYKISDYFDGDDNELLFGFQGDKGGDGIRAGESVTFRYQVTGVSFSFLDSYYQDLDAYFAVARFKGIGASGNDSSKTPGGGTSQLTSVPLPATTGLAFSGLATFGLLQRRRR
jgi:hypothetical protein